MKLVPLDDIFIITYGNKFDLCKAEDVPGEKSVAFVSRTGNNNGVAAFVAPMPEVLPFPAGYLTVALGGAILSTFLQPRPFYTAQNVAVLQPRTPLTRDELLYYCSAIRANRFRYSAFGREANRTLRSIMVPALDSVPDFVKNREADALDAAVESGLDQAAKNPMDSSSWQSFTYESLFDIKKGKALTKDEMLPGDTPFVGASSFNNGVTARISQEPQHPAGALTVSSNGSVGEVFYQPEPFWASSDVAVFYPRFETSREVAIFLATLIRLEKFRYNYGRKWGLETMKKSILRLPVDANGAPDFDGMTALVRQLPSWKLIADLA